MSEIITVNGVEYVRKCTSEEKDDVRIVILQRGWNMVGYFRREGNDCYLEKASVIRVWGTSKGLGELAKDGPTKNTVLDECYGVVQFDYLTVVATINVDKCKWKNLL